MVIALRIFTNGEDLYTWATTSPYKSFFVYTPIFPDDDEFNEGDERILRWLWEFEKEEDEEDYFK